MDISNLEDVGRSTIARHSYSFLECKLQLMSDFPNLYSFTISEIINFHNGKYIKAYKSIVTIMNEFVRKYPNFGIKESSKIFHVCVRLTNDDGETSLLNIHAMPRCRPRIRIKPIPLLLKQEIEFIKQELVHTEQSDRTLALSLLEEDYQEMGQLIECACCYGKCVFDNMAQCMEGHLVCVECLNAFTKETVYGAGKIALGCMTQNCIAIYPQDELKRCLPEVAWKKLEERALVESLSMAKVADLVKCPHCEFAAILSPRAKVFHCYRENCQKETCRDCGTDWVKHNGKPCAALETEDETSLRKEFEEKMTQAKVRTCIKCNTQFTKDSGCNKMTCRCAATMCYICRTPEVSYEHFCRHVLTPGKGCEHCNACNLWTSSEADDERAIQEIRNEAHSKWKEYGFQYGKIIGVPQSARSQDQRAS